MSTIYFFRFLLNIPELLKQWLQAMKRKNFTPSYSKICCEHFLSSVILDRPGTYKRHLKPDALPTVFPAMSLYYQTIPKKPRRKLERTVSQEVGSVNTLSIENPCMTTNENNIGVETVEKLNLKIDESVQTEKKPLHLSVITLGHKVKVLQQKVRR